MFRISLNISLFLIILDTKIPHLLQVELVRMGHGDNDDKYASRCGFLPHHVFFLSIIFYAAVQFLFFIAIKSDKKDVKFTDYTPWSKNDTYFETCQQCYIGNYTWGNRLTNLVDKANAKPIVEAMNIKKNPKDLHHDIQQRKHFRFYHVEYEADSSAI